MQVIIFPNDDGNISVVYPNLDCGLTIEEIAKKDVPTGKPFKIVDSSILPQNQLFFDAWQADFSDADGVGMGNQQWFIQKYQEQIQQIEQMAYPEKSDQETQEQYLQGLNSFNEEKQRLINALQDKINIQQKEMNQ